MKHIFTLFTLLFIFTQKSSAQQFARGADIGWLSEMEASGRIFYDKNGQQKDPLDILSEYCINSIRLRVWVNPANGYSGQADVINLAKRASTKGFRTMIDFHYSDHWADPGKQTKPAAWANYSANQLSQAVYNHTYTVLNALKEAGVAPEWVQIGNETNNGMLWEEGRATNSMANYATFVTSGHNAAKEVFPSTITIVHVANGFDNELFRWNIGGLIDNGAKFDAIGMSLYPEPNNWQTLNDQCLTNMKDMVTRYNKKILITEIGMSVSAELAAKSFVEDIINKNMSLANNMGLGVFWWEPLAYNWRGYDKVAWKNNGRPTEAMDGFLTNCNPQEKRKLTFKIDMSGQSTENGVFITGNMLNWQITPMGNLGNNQYSYTMDLAPGDTGAYYFLNANSWDARETVPLECTKYWNKDRGFEMPDQDLVIEHTWASCAGVITSKLSSKAENEIHVFPNPFKESFQVNAIENMQYSIYDPVGIIRDKGACNSSTKIGNNLPTGTYMLKLQSGNEVILKKIHKE
jgi:arabinogalactan endo-1,4-beta-galactosidase